MQKYKYLDKWQKSEKNKFIFHAHNTQFTLRICNFYVSKKNLLTTVIHVDLNWNRLIFVPKFQTRVFIICISGTSLWFISAFNQNTGVFLRDIKVR